MNRLIIYASLLIAAWIVLIVAQIREATAMEQTPDGFRLTPAELARCSAGGGCVVIPILEMRIELEVWLKRAFDAGRAAQCGT